MSAEIETIAYTGKMPWHGIGAIVKEAVTPQEILVKAGLDWRVLKQPMYTPDVNGQKLLKFTDLFAMVRDTDEKILGVCGPNYQPFQNSETFEFFNKFTEAGKMRMEVAGALKGGTWVWALARIEEGYFNLMGEDPNYSYLLLCSPHVWGKAMTILFTGIRVVCWNTLTQALSQSLSDKFRMLHTAPFADVRALAELSVEQAMIHKAVYAQKAELLASVKIVDMTKLYEYIAQIFQPNLLKEGEVKPTEFSRTGDQILMNYNTAPGSKLSSANNTWWGAFNAVTYFFDHQRGKIGPDKRMFDSWLSYGDAVTKRKAFDLAVHYAQAA